MSDRCPGCGQKLPAWTPQLILDAARRFADEHGRPPKVVDWHDASPWNPSKRTVYTHFGSWPKFLVAAGLEPHRQSKRWTRDEVISAMFRWRFEHGQLPKSRDWDNAGPWWPNRRTVMALFGEWNAAVVAAGYRPCQPRRSDRGYRAVMAGVTKAAA